MNIGSAIESCRKLKHLSKTALARRAEVSVSYLSLLEKGDREAPNLVVLENIAKALGLPLSLLLFLASDDEQHSAYLSDATIDEIKKTIEYLLKQDQGELFPHLSR